MSDSRPDFSISNDELTRLGFPVRQIAKVCGSPTEIRAGTTRSEALLAAFTAGVIRLHIPPARHLDWAPPRVDPAAFEALTGKPFPKEA